VCPQEGNYINHRALNVAWLLATVKTLPRRLRDGDDVDTLLQEMKLHKDSDPYAEAGGLVNGGKHDKMFGILREMADNLAVIQHTLQRTVNPDPNRRGTAWRPVRTWTPG